jgi:excisionase family DNA binding protein
MTKAAIPEGNPDGPAKTGADVERLMAPDEVAARLSVPLATVRFWRSAGTGPRSIKVGRHVRYRPQDVEAWLEQNSTPAA